LEEVETEDRDLKKAKAPKSTKAPKAKKSKDRALLE